MVTQEKDILNPRERLESGREKYVRQVTWGGFTVNLLLSGLKFAAGYFGHSHALVADAIHSLSDTTTDLAVIAGSHYWSRPADECHPYGHRRLETLVTVFIGLMLAAAGAGIGWHAVSMLSESPGPPPGWIALTAALVSITAKEILYRWTAAAGKKSRSPALAANAWHHRSDALSSVPVLIAVGAALVHPSWSFLDLVGAAVVAVFIMHAALKIIWPAVSELVDAGAPGEIKKYIADIATQTEGVQEVHAIRTRYISASIMADLHIVVAGSLSVRAGHNIAEDVRRRIIDRIPEVIDVVIHVDPPEAALHKEKPSPEAGPPDFP